MNPYEILGLDEDCTDEDIKKAYRNLSKKHHPDIGGDAEVFARASISADILRDPIKRKMWDENGILLDSGISAFEELVSNRFKDMVQQWIDRSISSNNISSLTKYMRGTISQNKAAISEAIKDMDIAISKLDEMNSKVKSKDTSNTVKLMIENKRKGIEQTKLNINKDKYILSLIEEKSKLYSYEEINDLVAGDKNPFRERFATGGFVNVPNNDDMFRKVFRGCI